MMKEITKEHESISPKFQYFTTNEWQNHQNQNELAPY